MVDCDWETWQVILKELREGTPDTPERIAMMRRADALHAKFSPEAKQHLIRPLLESPRR